MVLKVKKFTKWMFLLVGVLALTSCLKDDVLSMKDKSVEEQVIQSSFDYKTTSNYNLEIQAKDIAGEAYENVPISIYLEEPMVNSDGSFELPNKGKVATVLTNAEGRVVTELKFPSYLEKIYVVSNYMGLPQLTEVELNSPDVDINLSAKKASAQVNLKSVSSAGELLGGWNSLGVPDYLEPIDDYIDQQFMDDINASLPENTPLPISHPDYFNEYALNNIILEEDAEVWLTFVWEGAGKVNTLGYYHYPTNNPPASTLDIDHHTAFPNVSFPAPDKGGLVAGNKVQLKYKDPSTGVVSTVFPQGTSIGYYLKVNGWDLNNHIIQNGKYTHYSDYKFNVESVMSKRQHNILLVDEVREKILLGFEDLHREINSDEDFNDAVFYATISPFTAVDPEDYNPIDTPDDTDGDGVSDRFDDYPTDPERAFDNYYPAQGVYGSLVFEDLWPGKGDYDFNDAVIDYNYNVVTNAQNNTVEVLSKFKLRAIGAAFSSGFGIELTVDPNDISSITGQHFTGNYLNLAGNGTENGQTNAVIPVFDDGKHVLPLPASGWTYNTELSNPKVGVVELELLISFGNRIYKMSELGSFPFNPFLMINKERGREVHLVNHMPTDKANPSYFGTLEDWTDFSLNRSYISSYFVSSDQYFAFPWVLDIPESFDYPIEKAPITDTYTHFEAWTKSNGEEFPDWYKDLGGYRVESLIYR